MIRKKRFGVIKPFLELPESRVEIINSILGFLTTHTNYDEKMSAIQMKQKDLDCKGHLHLLYCLTVIWIVLWGQTIKTDHFNNDTFAADFPLPELCQYYLFFNNSYLKTGILPERISDRYFE